MRNGFYLLITTCLVLFATASLSAQTVLEKANKLYDLHAYRQAAKIYENYFNANDTNSFAAGERLADCYWQLNNAPKTIGVLAPIADANMASSFSLLNYGNALMSLGKYDQATSVFKKLKQTEPAIAAQMLASCQFAAAADNQVSNYKISPVSAVNTPASELSASIFENQLIWASSRTDLKRAAKNGAVENDWTGAANHQLFVANIDSNTNSIGKTQFFKSDFKNVFNESYVSFSADGRQAAFMRSNITDGRRIASNTGIEMSVYTASIDDAGNFFDVKPYPYNNGACGFPCLTGDGQTLYFASDRQGGFGGFDIYSARRLGTTWAEPRNMGNAINSQGDEITPFVSAKTFYFASNFQTGLGGFDIFKTNGLMSQIENLGVGVNSSGDDFGFILNPNSSTAYFISNRAGGKGSEDIYMARELQQNTAIVTTKDMSAPAIFTKPTSNVPGSYSTTGLPNFTGMVTDGSSGEPLENVIVRAKNIKTNALIEAQTDKRGRYILALNKASDYDIAFSKEGFVNDKKAVKPTALATKYIGETILNPSAVTNKITVIEDVPKPIIATTASESDKIFVKPSSSTTNTGSEKDITVRPSSTTTAKNIPSDYDIVVKPAGAKNIPSDYDIVVKPVGTKTSSLASVSNTSDKKFYAINLETDEAAWKSDDTPIYSTYTGKNYDKLKELSGGNVYRITAGGITEVRLGVFASKAKAEVFAKKINTYNLPSVLNVVEEKDYKVVANNIIIEKPNQVPSDYSIKVKKSPQAIKPIPTDQSITIVKKSPTTPDTDYKVRIAAFKNPQLFDATKVSQLGKITAVQQGGLTIFLIDGFTYFDDAHEYKKKVQALGYKDAKVVVKEGDKYRVVD